MKSPQTNNPNIQKDDSTIDVLGSRWKSADQIAGLYGRSRPWVYAITDRFKLRNVSLGASGKTGARLFDALQLEELLHALAERQKDTPRINPRAKIRAVS